MWSLYGYAGGAKPFPDADRSRDRAMRRLLVRLACLPGLLAGSRRLRRDAAEAAEKGPGGADYVAAEVTKRAVGRASAATYVFHAAGPRQRAAPGRRRPAFLGRRQPACLRRLDRAPRPQGPPRPFPALPGGEPHAAADATAIAATLLKEALAALADDPEARPDLSGSPISATLPAAPIALNLAAAAPRPTACRAEARLRPSCRAASPPTRRRAASRSTTCPEVDAATCSITMSGDRDYLPTDRAARRLLRETTAVPHDPQALHARAARTTTASRRSPRRSPRRAR